MRAAWGEVVVTYGDTPVAVRHVRREAGRRLSPRALLGLGGLLLVAGAACFLADVRQDWDAHALAVRTAHERGDVRPSRPGPGFGGPGAALALLGLVPFVLGAVRRGDPQRREFTIGEAHDASFQVATPDLPGPVFPLLRAEAGPVLRFTAATRGELTIGATRAALGAWIAAGRTEASGAVHRITLAPGARARVEHGPLTLWISAVEPETAKVARGKLDGPTWFYSGSALLVLGGLLILAHQIPRHDGLAMSGDTTDRFRLVGYLVKPQVPPPGDARDSSGGAGGPEGSLASQEVDGGGRDAATSARPGRRASPGGAPVLGRDYDPERAARSAGVLAILGSTDYAALGTGAYTTGAGDGDVWAGLTGTEIGERNDVGGLGLSGTGEGGALHGEGAIGLGNVGLIGKGGGCGCVGRGNGIGAGFGGRGTRVPRVSIPAAGVAQGALDKDIIRRVVRAHLSEIRHCYNQTLVRDPQAHGRVVVEFMIGGTGKVTTAVVGESDMADAGLGACATQAVRRWSFPRPEGGGNVMVSYPFAFAPA
jgi:TonB family protein